MPKYKLVKRPDSPNWFVGWSERGRSKRFPTGTSSREEAESFLSAFGLERGKPDEANLHDLAVAQVLSWYYDEHASKRPSAEQADIAIKHLNRFYGASLLSAINSATNAQYERDRRDLGIGWQTINRERMVLRAALNHARKHHGLLLVPHVPTILADHPENKPVEPKGRPLSTEELGRLYQASDGHMRTFLLILIGTLCRPGAAIDLQPSKQCDFEHKLLDLNPPGRAQTKKVRPVVPLVPFLAKALKDVKGYAVSYHGQKIASTKTAWRALREDAGLDARVTPYSVRHTVARWLRSQRVPGDEIGIMLGHRPVNASRTDLIYAPYEPGYCAHAAKAIQSLHRLIHRNARQSRASANVDRTRMVRKSALG